MIWTLKRSAVPSLRVGRIHYVRNLLAVFLVGFIASAACGNQALPLEKIKLPPGFSIGVYATGVRNAREMALGSSGTLFVGSMNSGSVYAVVGREIGRAHV